MQPLPHKPKTPQEFVDLMMEIWVADCKPLPDSGLVCETSVLYDDWHDAHNVARAVGLKRTGGSVRNEEHGNIYRFENGVGVFVNSAGSRIDQHCSRFRARKEKV